MLSVSGIKKMIANQSLVHGVNFQAIDHEQNVQDQKNISHGIKRMAKPCLIIAAISMIGLAGCAGSLKDRDPSYTHSLQSQQELQHWDKKYQSNRNDSANAIGFAKALMKNRQEDRALSVMQEAHSLNPDDQNLTSEYGRIALSAGDNQLASQLLGQASKDKKEDWKILSAKGVLEARAGRNKQAIKYFHKALKLNPQQASILNNLGLAYAVTGKYAQAEKHLKQALWDSRHIRQVRQNLALVYAMQGKVKEADAIALEPLPAKYQQSAQLQSKPGVNTKFETIVERAKN